jgi:hypothetical protein
MKIGPNRWESLGAHRVSWLIHRGAIPPGLFVCHRCDNRRCVRPSHLFLGRLQDNHLDMERKGRIAHGELHGQAKLTADQVMLIRRQAECGTLNAAKLAEAYGVHPGTITTIASRQTWRHIPGGRPRRIKTKLTAAKVREIREEIAAGGVGARTRIAERLGMTVSAVAYIARGHNWASAGGPIAKTERRPGAKLTPADVAEIRGLLRDGLTHQAIAACFGVARPTISDLSRGEAWG